MTASDAPAPSVEVDGLTYAFDRPPRPRGRRSVVTVRLASHAEDPGFTDRVDVYAFRSRQAFAARVADAFGRDVGQVLGHLAVVLDAADRARARAGEAEPEALSPARRDRSDALLAQPGLLAPARPSPLWAWSARRATPAWCSWWPSAACSTPRCRPCCWPRPARARAT